MDGFLNVNKPAGWTSFDVVAFVRRRTRAKRVGHGGTLDPMATGVLPVAIGRATRVLEYVGDAAKAYRAEITLGVATNTYDAEGEVTATADASDVSRVDVEAALPRFVGEIQQAPPPFSAVKRGGKPLYAYARKGEAVAAEPRPVVIRRIDLLDYRPPVLAVEVECGKGTYIRSLAHDLGGVLGTGAHLSALVRTRVGPFRLEDSVTADEIQEAARGGSWSEHLHSLDAFLLHWHAAVLNRAHERMVRVGRALHVPSIPTHRYPDGLPCRAYSLDGDFLAVLRYAHDSHTWRPEKVLAAQE